MEDSDLRYLAEQIRKGRAILFTGAGFSLRAKDMSGRQIPGVGQLTQELWDIEFSGRPYDGSSLGDVYEAGLLQARRSTEALMRDRLTVDPAHFQTNTDCGSPSRGIASTRSTLTTSPKLQRVRMSFRAPFGQSLP